MSDSNCGPKKPKRANRRCHFDPNCILSSKGKLAIQLKFGYNIAIS